MSSLDEGALPEHVAINRAHGNDIAGDWVEMGEGAWAQTRLQGHGTHAAQR